VEPGVGTPKISENNDLAAKPVNPMNCLETRFAVRVRSLALREAAMAQTTRKGMPLNEPLSSEGVGEEGCSVATAARTLQAGFYLTALNWPPTGLPSLP
jgi:hypothetical protein